jgi:hypothetical protein
VCVTPLALPIRWRGCAAAAGVVAAADAAADDGVDMRVMRVCSF